MPASIVREVGAAAQHIGGSGGLDARPRQQTPMFVRRVRRTWGRRARAGRRGRGRAPSHRSASPAGGSPAPWRSWGDGGQPGGARGCRRGSPPCSGTRNWSASSRQVEALAPPRPMVERERSADDAFRAILSLFRAWLAIVVDVSGSRRRAQTSDGRSLPQASAMQLRTIIARLSKWPRLLYAQGRPRRSRAQCQATNICFCSRCTCARRFYFAFVWIAASLDL